MKPLQAAIYDKFTAVNGGGLHNSFYTALGGRLYYEHAPQNTVFPLGVFYIIENNFDYLFFERYEQFEIQFSLFSNSASSSEVGDLFDYLKSLYDFCSLSATGFTFLKMNRIFSTSMWLEVEKIWQYVIRYNIVLQGPSKT